MALIVPKGNAFRTADRARVFATLTTKGDRIQYLCIRAFWPVFPDAGGPEGYTTAERQALIKSSVDAARAAVYSINVENLDESFNNNLVYYDGIYGNGLIAPSYYNVSYNVVRRFPQVSYPEEPINLTYASGFNDQAITTLRYGAGYGLLHNPWALLHPTDIFSLVPWQVVVQRNICTAVSSGLITPRVNRGYFHGGLSFWIGTVPYFTRTYRSTEIPLDDVSEIASLPQRLVGRNQTIDVPFPDPNVYGYPDIAPDDPYMVGHTSVYQSTTGTFVTPEPYAIYSDETALLFPH